MSSFLDALGKVPFAAWLLLAIGMGFVFAAFVVWRMTSSRRLRRELKTTRNELARAKRAKQILRERLGPLHRELDKLTRAMGATGVHARRRAGLDEYERHDVTGQFPIVQRTMRDTPGAVQERLLESAGAR